MRVETEGGEVIDLGTLETGLTVGITDYSKRTTDDFGVTTVVPRGFSRTMSVRLGVPTGDVDGLQRSLADLRATSALWIADDRYQWLSAQGFYKDFSLDLPDPVLSYCTLTVEGLAETETSPGAELTTEAGDDLLTEGGDTLLSEGSGSDAPGDPAPVGQASTLQLLQPITVTDDVLVSTSVAEDDYPVWSSTATYAAGTRRLRAHRVYESIVSNNVGHDPIGDATRWLDVGPTNCWAMFDQTLGTTTAANGQVIVTLTPATAVTGLALLDVDGGMVRVQAPGYDRTSPVSAGTVTFLDLNAGAGASITVTIAAGGPELLTEAGVELLTENGITLLAEGTSNGGLSVGTFLLGRLVGLGITETSPTAGIADFSKKNIDDFGEVTVVERAWSKTMSAKALIRTDTLDLVANRIASVRSEPSLWIGQAGLDSLTVYGFWKNFSIEVDESTSKLSLSIEGLSTAAPVSTAPLDANLNWDTLPDPKGTKPANNATVGAPLGTPVGTTTSNAIQAAIAVAQSTIASLQSQVAAIQSGSGGSVSDLQTQLNQAVTNLNAEIARAQGQEGTLFTRVATAQSTADGNTSLISTETTQRTTADSALSAQISTVSSAAGSNAAAITSEAATRASADSALGVRIDNIDASSGGSGAAIASEAAARASADASLAGRIDTVTSVSSRAINPNSTFDLWAISSSPPAQWNWWDGDSSAGIRRDGGQNGHLYAAAFDVSANQKAGLMSNVLLSAFGAYIITVSGRATDWQGAAVHVHFGNNDLSVVPESVTINCASDQDTAGYASRDGGGGGFRRTWSSFYKTGINGNIVALRIFAMANWEAVGERAAKSISFDEVSIRPATAAEIAGQRADTNATSALAQITSEAATRASQDAAFAGTQSTLIAQLAGTQGSGLKGQIDSNATVAANATGAVASTVTSLQATVGSQQATLSIQSGAVASLQGRTGVFLQVVGDAGGGRKSVSFYADANGGGGLNIVGDLAVTGNILLDGTFYERSIAPGQISNSRNASQSGSQSVSAFTSPHDAVLCQTGSFSVGANDFVYVTMKVNVTQVPNNIDGSFPSGQFLVLERSVSGGTWASVLAINTDQGYIYTGVTSAAGVDPTHGAGSASYRIRMGAPNYGSFTIQDASISVFRVFSSS